MSSQPKEDPKPILDRCQRGRRDLSPPARKSLPGDGADILTLDKAPDLHATLGRADLYVKRDTLDNAGEGQEYYQLSRPVVERIHRDNEAGSNSRLFMAP
jgi:hypothetical protein